MEVKFKNRLDRGKIGSMRSMTILNRIPTVTDQGLEYEADQRHAEISMKDICIDESSKGVVTPGVVSTSEGGKAEKEKHDRMEEKVCSERWL